MKTKNSQVNKNSKKINLQRMKIKILFKVVIINNYFVIKENK